MRAILSKSLTVRGFIEQRVASRKDGLSFRPLRQAQGKLLEKSFSARSRSRVI